MMSINETLLVLKENIRIARLIKDKAKTEYEFAYANGYETAMVNALCVIRGNHESFKIPICSKTIIQNRFFIIEDTPELQVRNLQEKR